MPIRVMLVDDHNIVREGLRFILEAQSDMVVVGEASDGLEAVTLAAQRHPDVVIIDIAMPKLNGIETTCALLKDHPSMQIIILSMHLSTEYIERALNAGALGYLLKDSAGKELITAIHAVMNHQRYLSPKVADVLIENYLLLSNTNRQTSPYLRLSMRERQTLMMIAEGKSITEIAGLLSLSTSTVDTYRSRLMSKLGITDISGLIKYAIRNGLVDLE